MAEGLNEAPSDPASQPRESGNEEPVAFMGKASQEVLPLRGFGELLKRASARLVFLFLGGFLLGCHEVFPPFERFVLPRFSTGHLDARATQVLV